MVKGKLELDRIRLLRVGSVCLLWAWLGIACAWGQEDVRNLAVLKDVAGTETIATVAAAPERFSPLPHALSAGYTRTAHWLRFSLPPNTTGSEWWLEVQPPYLDDLRLYEPIPGHAGEFTEHRAGDLLPFVAREVPYRAFVFRLPPSIEPTENIYLRLQTTSTSIALIRLWQPEDFHTAKAEEYGLLGMFYGIFVAVLLFHLIYWLWLRTPLTGLYLLYLSIFAFLYLASNGLLAQFLLPQTSWLSDKSVGIGFFAVASVGGLFYRHILKVDRTTPWLNSLYLVHIAFPAILLPFSLAGYHPEAARLANLLILAVLPVSLFLSSRLWRQQEAGSASLFFSCVFSLLGVTASILSLLGIGPVTIWGLHGAQIGVFGNILMLHLAVTSRIKQMNIERQQALLQVTLAEQETEREKTALREQSQFLAMLSHELKTPLAVINIAVESLRHLVAPANPQVELRHDRIRRAVSRIDSLVEQFLRQDRIDNESLTLDMTEVRLDALMREAAERYEEKEIRLSIAPTDLPTIWADASLLDVALSNLLDNAIKYGRADTPVEIAIYAAEEEAASDIPGIAVDVTNKGPDIPPEAQEKLFDKYVRGPHSGDIPGAGLGLYLVWRIAQLHGGSIRLADATGGSIRFRLWIPLNSNMAKGKTQ